MEKVLKILHKKLDKKRKDPYFKNESKKMENLFHFDKLTYIDKNEFDFYKNQIKYHGIINKQVIEKAYKEARIKMADYYDVLNYEQKNRLMDYEIKLKLKELKSFTFENQNIYIPFFDLKMNGIYENEMVLFDLKKYADLMLYYESYMQENLYGYKIYDSCFSSLQYICENEKEAAVYCPKKERLYFLNCFNMEDFISVPKIEKEKMEVLSMDYFNKDIDKFIDDLFAFSCINEKIYKKLTKKRK